MSVIHVVCGREKAMNICQNEMIFWWDKYDNAQSEYSIPAYYKENFITLRAELVDFFYELGMKNLHEKPLYQHFCAGDRLSMWWCSLLYEKHPMFMPELYEILKLLCLEQMLEKFAPHCTHLKLYSEDILLNQIVKEFCCKNKLQFSAQKHKLSNRFLQKTIVQKIKNYSIFHVIVAKFRFWHWLLAIRSKVEYIRENCVDKPCITIATYFPTTHNLDKEQGGFCTPYWQTLQNELLKAKKNINWLLIRINSPIMSFKQAVTEAKKHNFNKTSGASFHFVEEFLSLAEITQALLRYLKLYFVSQNIKKHIRHFCHIGGMNVWPYLEQYYAKSFQGWLCFERCLQRRAMLGYVRWAGVQEYTLFPLENCPWERMLSEAIHYSGAGQVYGAQHSVIRATDFRYFEGPKLFNNAEVNIFLPHKILVNGHAAYTAMLEAGTAKHMLYEVEALRYLHLAKRKQVAVQNNIKSKQLIVVTSYFSESVHEHIKLLAKWFYEKSNDEWQVFIKPHPYCCVKPALKKYFSNAQQICILNMGMEAVLDKAKKNSAIIWAANDTTVIVEALYAKIPLLVQNEGYNIDYCPLQGIDALEYVYTFEDVQRALDKKQILPVDEDFFNLSINHFNDTKLPKWQALLDF